MNVSFIQDGHTIALYESMDHLPDKGDRIYIKGFKHLVEERTFHHESGGGVIWVAITLANISTGRSLR